MEVGRSQAGSRGFRNRTNQYDRVRLRVSMRGLALAYAQTKLHESLARTAWSSPKRTAASLRTAAAGRRRRRVR